MARELNAMARWAFVVHNPESGRAAGCDLDRLAPLFDRVEPLPIATSDQLQQVLERAARESASGPRQRFVIAAGGDGTVSTVANAILRSDHDWILGIIPCGTGNDFARALQLPLDSAAAIDLLAQPRIAAVDVLRMTAEGGQARFVVNNASAGNSPRVSDSVDREDKELLGPIAYLAASVGVVAGLETYSLCVTVDDEPRLECDAINVLLANGPTVSGGIGVNPAANLVDGQLELIVARSGNLADLLALGTRFLLSDYLASDQVIFRQARRVRIECSQAFPLSLDGEVSTSSWATFEVLPAALRVVVGPDWNHTSDPNPPGPASA